MRWLFRARPLEGREENEHRNYSVFRPRARGRRSAAKRTTTILRAATTTSTITRRCAVARSVFV